MIPLSCISPRFLRFSLHQSSTNILPQIIYQTFAKAEGSTESYTLSMTLCGNYSQLNINIEQSLYQKVGEIIVPLFEKAQHWINFLYIHTYIHTYTFIQILYTNKFIYINLKRGVWRLALYNSSPE